MSNKEGLTETILVCIWSVIGIVLFLLSTNWEYVLSIQFGFLLLVVVILFLLMGWLILGVFLVVPINVACTACKKKWLESQIKEGKK